MKENERLCPFKKATERDDNPMNGKTTIHERFEVCAGKRCMAYRSGGTEERCLRLEVNNGT